MKRLHGVGGHCTGFVPTRIDALLEFGEAVSTKAHDVGVGRNANVIDEHTELPHPQFMHALKLFHYTVQHGGIGRVGKCLARVNGPHEVDLALMGCSGDVAHHVLR